MRVDDRFDDVVASLGGFYRTWYAYVGLELGLLQRDQHARQLVLDALELADRTAELDAHLGVLDRHLEHLLGAADHLVREGDRSLVERFHDGVDVSVVVLETAGRPEGEALASLPKP